MLSVFGFISDKEKINGPECNTDWLNIEVLCLLGFNYV